MKPTTINQVIGDFRAAIKRIGGHGQVEVRVAKNGEVLIHEVHTSPLLEEEWRRLMEEVPRGRK